MKNMVSGQWPTLPVHITKRDLILIGRDLYIYSNIAVRHNNHVRYFYTKLLTKYHLDKVMTKVFDNKGLHNINFRSFYLSHLIGKFSLHTLNLSLNRDAHNNFFPIPLFTSNLHLFGLTKRLMIRITSIDTLAIVEYKTALISSIPNSIPDVCTEV